MANAQTEHSKKLRAKTAAAYVKKQREQGLVKQIAISLPTEIANDFNAMLADLGKTKKEGVIALLELYKKSKE